MGHKPIRLKIKKTTVKLLLFSILICYLFRANSIAQENSKKTNICPGFGIGIGFFNPKGVNEYINYELSSYYQQFGTFDMFMYYELNGSVTLKIKQLDVTALAAYAISPKFIIISNTSDIKTYTYSRLSPGILANYYIPFGTGRYSLFIGGGAQFHHLKFKEFNGNNIGIRLQVGLNLKFGNTNMQPHIALNLAKVKDGMIVNSELYDLNFTGGQVGINLIFR